ncbi:MAG: helix-turn-helix transcriptional regulator [Eubacterium sp.]|nr:helix-turn-helix transcriptional regulator [Eubacterium sp.]
MISKEDLEKIQFGFSEKLKKFRESRNLTQSAFAKLIGLSKATYNRYETLHAQPSMSLLIKMASVLEVTLNELVGFDGVESISNIDETYYTLNDMGIDYKILKPDETLILIGKDSFRLNDSQLMDSVAMSEDIAEKTYYHIYRELFKLEFQRNINYVLSSHYPNNCVDKEKKND